MSVFSKQRSMFDSFNEDSRQALSFAQDEAKRFNHNYIGTEHLLLGLLRQERTVAAAALASLGVGLRQARDTLVSIVGRGDRVVLGDTALTPRSKKVLELAVDEARRLRHRAVGPEHILLGITRECDGIAADMLASLGVTLEAVRGQVLALVSSGPIPPGDGHGAEMGQEPAVGTPAATREPGGVKSNVVTCRLDDASLDALDALVEAGVRSTRSDAAAWLIAAGIESHRALFDRVNATVGEIRRLRAEARTLAEQVIAEGQESERPSEPDEPSGAGESTPEG